MTMKRLIVVLVAVGALAGCSSSGKAHSTASAFATHYGDDAAVIANHVPACKAVTATSDLVRAATSGATCRMDGHLVTIYGWPNAKTNAQPLSNLNNLDHATYFARGTGWSAITSDTVTTAESRAIAQRFISALGGSIVRS